MPWAIGCISGAVCRWRFKNNCFYSMVYFVVTWVFGKWHSICHYKSKFIDFYDRLFKHRIGGFLLNQIIEPFGRRLGAPNQTF